RQCTAIPGASVFRSQSDEHLDLHSFPTRRSSDLQPGALADIELGLEIELKALHYMESYYSLVAQSAMLDQTARYGKSDPAWRFGDRKSTRLNSSHVEISYAVFCLKKKKNL